MREVNRCTHSPPSGVLPIPASALAPCPEQNDFLTRLDDKLRRRNRRLIDQLLAWGGLLDTAGWSVALGWGGDDFWLSGNARRDLMDLGGNPDNWPSLVSTLEKSVAKSLHRKSDGVLIWSRQQGKPEQPRPAAGLTPRESEIMSWLRQGKTGSEIAIILDRAPRTVDKHLANLYRKMGVRNRASVILAQQPLA